MEKTLVELMTFIEEFAGGWKSDRISFYAVMPSGDYLCIDNTKGDCCVEEAKSKELATKWVTHEISTKELWELNNKLGAI